MVLSISITEIHVRLDHSNTLITGVIAICNVESGLKMV